MKFGEVIDLCLQKRTDLIDAMERYRYHHLIRKNVKFYLDENGLVKYSINENVSLEDRRAVTARMTKIDKILEEYNNFYGFVLSEIKRSKSAGKMLKVFAEKSLAHKNEFYEKTKESIMNNERVRPKGEFDVNKLTDCVATKKNSLLLMQDMINFEQQQVEQLCQTDENIELKY